MIPAPTFAAAAAQLAGQTGVLFGWTPDTFWTATPAELAAIYRALGTAAPARLDRAAVETLMERLPDG